MYGYRWVLLASLFGSGLSQFDDPCFTAVTQFSATHMMSIPENCQIIQNQLTNEISYRINFNESTVNYICDESINMICLEALQIITLVCTTFVSMEFA